MTTRSQSFECEDVSIEGLVEGSGPLVVMIASVERSSRDFDDLPRSVAAGELRRLAFWSKLF
jgi:hypothetical protein